MPARRVNSVRVRIGAGWLHFVAVSRKLELVDEIRRRGDDCQMVDHQWLNFQMKSDAAGRFVCGEQGETRRSARFDGGAD